MNNTAAIAQEGLRYRDTVLAMGGGRDPLLVFKVGCGSSQMYGRLHHVSTCAPIMLCCA